MAGVLGVYLSHGVDLHVCVPPAEEGSDDPTEYSGSGLLTWLAQSLINRDPTMFKTLVMSRGLCDESTGANWNDYWNKLLQRESELKQAMANTDAKFKELGIKPPWA